MTNPDNAVSQVVFSVAANESGLAPLFEKQLSTPVHNETYIGNNSDRLFGQMAEYDRHLYVFNTNITENINAMWSYDIDEDSWECCAELPDDLAGTMLAGITAFNHKIYVSVSGDSNEQSKLWTYDPETDAWDVSTLSLPRRCALCVLNGKLIGIEGIHEFTENDEEDPSDFSIYDPEIGITTKLDCAIPSNSIDALRLRVTATDHAIYIYGPDVGVEGSDYLGGMLFRATWNDDETNLEVEDLNAAFNDLSVQHLNEQIAIAGLPNGVAIIGSGLHGEDTHIIYDDSDWAVPYDHTLSYHFTYTPMAVYTDGWLYGLGYSTTEEDLMFFRATNADHTPNPISDLRQMRKSKEPKNEKIQTK